MTFLVPFLVSVGLGLETLVGVTGVAMSACVVEKP